MFRYLYVIFVLLSACGGSPGSLSEIPHITEEEKNKIVSYFNDFQFPLIDYQLAQIELNNSIAQYNDKYTDFYNLLMDKTTNIDKKNIKKLFDVLKKSEEMVFQKINHLNTLTEKHLLDVSDMIKSDHFADINESLEQYLKYLNFHNKANENPHSQTKKLIEILTYRAEKDKDSFK